ncbi:hypothetical protein IWW36_004553, partial [Coemansia brasiliensis]
NSNSNSNSNNNNNNNMHCSFSIASILSAAGMAVVAQTYPAPHMHARSFVGYPGFYPYAGFGYGVGFPFASSFTNAFNANSNFANYNDDTLFVNNQDATTANSNLNTFNNANVIA